MTPTTQGRSYESTHPWLSFQLDLRKASTRLWMLLGEGRSKIEHISGSLLKPDVAQRLHEVFLAKGVHATTAIEGNTLTEQQAQELIKGTLRLPESQQYLATEVDNIVTGFNTIRDALLQGGPRDVSVDMILGFNRQVIQRLELEDDVVPGEIRHHSVVVGRYRGAPAEDCRYLLERMCDWLNGSSFEAATADLHMPFAVLKAVAAHLYLAWIHPFGDGNGRTARLMELQILLAAGVPTPATHLLSNHYNQTRAEYQRRLDVASRDPDSGVLDFIEYAVAGFVDGLREQLMQIREYQFNARWEQYIYEAFGEANSPTQVRRRQLVLDLSKETDPVSRASLRRLTPSIAEAYAKKTTKTLSRDINVLREMHLIRWRRIVGPDGRARAGFVANRQLIEAFRPLSASSHASDDEPHGAA